ATDAYEQAVALAGNEPGAADLHVIHAAHRDAAAALRLHVEHFGGAAEQGATPWKRFALHLANDAKLAGNKPALGALKDAEEEANRLYEKALMDDSLPLECRSLIASTLLPQGRSHAATLERLLRQL